MNDVMKENIVLNAMTCGCIPDVGTETETREYQLGSRCASGVELCSPGACRGQRSQERRRWSGGPDSQWRLLGHEEGFTHTGESRGYTLKSEQQYNCCFVTT
ncbi:hypothetical protein EYF80_040871 [Liparis tanakae]|uniref:Uncharacterized protein n=1 Tax=Liparis tanakae TaxID=230148 RepID=A0A4Z2G5T4_9TELE|nr:hypothetical protein EYF80_040871 [Liparis tanakae]